MRASKMLRHVGHLLVIGLALSVCVSADVSSDAEEPKTAVTAVEPPASEVDTPPSEAETPASTETTTNATDVQPSDASATSPCPCPCDKPVPTYGSAASPGSYGSGSCPCDCPAPPPPPQAAQIETRIEYIWELSDELVAECNATTFDRFGDCGDDSAFETYALACQKLEITASSVNVLDKDVEVATLEAAEGEVNKCTEELKPVAIQSCAARECEEVEPRVFEGQCFSLKGLDCGSGKRTIKRSCFSVSTSTFIADAEEWPEECLKDGAAVIELDDCDLPACAAGARYVYGLYGECIADSTVLNCDACTDFDADGLCKLTGLRTRDAACMTVDESGELSDATEEDCTDDAVVSAACGITCRQELKFKVGEWSDCTATCDCAATGAGACTGGLKTAQQTRTVEACSAASTDPDCKVYRTEPAATKACASERCNPCAPVNGRPFCDADNTEGAGRAFEGTCQCTCKSGFAGKRCNLSTSAAAGASLTVGGAACAGRLDKDGNCCASKVVDREGVCCTNGLDGCGKCKETGVFRVGFDAKGACCEAAQSSVFLTGDFTCCASPDLLDDCGVCNGDNTSCRKRLSASIDTAGSATAATFFARLQGVIPGGATNLQNSFSGSSRRRSLLAVESVNYELAKGSGVTLADLTIGFLQAGAQAQNAGELAAVPAPPSPSVAAECGNQVCEAGEDSSSCDSDCPALQSCAAPAPGAAVIGDPAQMCGGNGACNLMTGECSCSAGYAGDACDECDYNNGYSEVVMAGGEYGCTLIASDFVDPSTPTTPTSPTTPTTPGAPPADSGSDGLSTGVIAGIAVAGVAVLALIIGSAFYFTRRAKNVDPQ